MNFNIINLYQIINYKSSKIKYKNYLILISSFVKNRGKNYKLFEISKNPYFDMLFFLFIF